MFLALKTSIKLFYVVQFHLECTPKNQEKGLEHVKYLIPDLIRKYLKYLKFYGYEIKEQRCLNSSDQNLIIRKEQLWRHYHY